MRDLSHEEIGHVYGAGNFNCKKPKHKKKDKCDRKSKSSRGSKSSKGSKCWG